MTTSVLKDLIEISKDGEWGQGDPFDDSVEMLAIRGTDFEDVRAGVVDTVPRRHIARRIAQRKTLQPWDLLIEAAGGTKGKITGRTVLLRPQLFQRSELPFTCASFSRFIRFRTDQCDPEFMFWYLQYLYDAGFMHAYPATQFALARVVPDHEFQHYHVLIEAKYIRKGTALSKVTDQIAADIVKYPASAYIVFAVYDPDRVIRDDVRFASDIESRRKCKVLALR